MARSVLVTGAADGIGRGIATCFIQRGDKVALLDYDGDKLDRTVAELRGSGGSVLALQADVRQAADIDAAVARAVEAHGGLDVAVNNAAVYPNTPVVDMEEAEWDNVLDTNLKGAFLFTRAAARQMLRQGRGGHLCLIASGAYRSARRGAAHYCASKAGLVMLAQTLALELAEHHINVNVVSPGFIEVGLRPGVSIPYRDKIKHDIPWGRFGRPDEIAHAVEFLCSPESEFITGSVLSVDGGSSAGRFHLPISST
ncbi:MAG TPA: SDR family NAD(P)-dependent oxidoreductase [Chloroflexota bacterium]|nr:SDR family NAD(P)-dependent oxidoreductase [Chloroflexota bacterium]